MFFINLLKSISLSFEMSFKMWSFGVFFVFCIFEFVFVDLTIVIVVVVFDIVIVVYNNLCIL